MQILNWIQSNGYSTVTADEITRAQRGEIQLPCKPIHLRFDDGWANQQYAVDQLRCRGMKATFYIISDTVVNSQNYDGYYLSVAQLKDWATSFEIGAHSRTHPDLVEEVTTQQARYDEIIGSANDLSAILGWQIRSFAYPYGAYNDDVVNIVNGSYRGSPFTYAVSTIESTSWTCDRRWIEPCIDMNFVQTISQLQNAINNTA